jgi:hypothetical protein
MMEELRRAGCRARGRLVRGKPLLANTRPRVAIQLFPRARRHLRGEIGIGEKARDRVSHGPRVLGGHDHACLALAKHRADIAGRCRDNRKTACERFENRDRLVVDDGGIQKDVRRVVDGRERGGIHAAEKADAVAGAPAQLALLAARAGDGQRRLREPCLQKGEGRENDSDPIVRLEVADREERRRERRSRSKTEERCVDDIGDDARGITVPREHALQPRRGNDDLIHHPQERRYGAAPAGEMIRRFAAVVVDEDRLAEKLRRQDCRDRSQQKRPVRCGEDMDDVRVPEAV